MVVEPVRVGARALILLWGVIFWRRLRGFFVKWGEVWSGLTERTVETLAGIRVVKAFAQEDREIAAFAKPNGRLREVAEKTAVNRGVFFATITFLTGLGVLVVWLLGGQQVLGGKMTLGTLLAFYSYMWLFYGPLEWFGQVNAWMSRAFAGAERIFEVIDTQPEAYEDPTAKRVPRMQGAIRFRGVTFGYDKSKPVLKDFDLDIQPGEMIGLVGKSGVGKTTTVNLIARFYDVDYGAIEIDGIDIRGIALRDLRSQIGIVLQEPVLFSGTIAENIGYGRPGSSFADIMVAARAANAHNFIMAKPDGYETQVGEKGAGLSGGERQRVSIARAILHNPRILILDEATASVDVETELQIQEAIQRLVEGRTTVAIAHRLSTLRNADRLMVLDDGRIVEAGTHAELMEKQGTFYELVNLQKRWPRSSPLRNRPAMSTFFLENLPHTVEAKVRSRKGSEEQVLIQVATDMAGEDRFEQRWLVVTSERLMVLAPNGASGDVEFALQAVKSARIEALVGGGRLELEREAGAPAHLYYSNSLAAKFAEVAEGIEQLKDGQDLNLPHELDRTHCEQCQRRLPEVGGICPVCIAKFDTFKRLIGYMLPYRLQLVLLLGLTVASSLLELAPPYIVKHLIDDVLVPGAAANINLLYWLVGGLFVIGVVEWCIGVVRRWLNVWVGFRAIEHLRTDLFKALQYLPLRFYDKRKVGALISRMNNDSEMVEDFLLFDMPYIVSNAAMIVGILGLLFYMNWELTLYVLAPVPSIVIGSSLIWNRLQRFWGRWSARWSRLTTHLNESISGIRVVKAFAQEHRESERFDQRNHALRQISVSAERAWLVFFMVTNFFMSFGGFFVWYFGGQSDRWRRPVARES